MKVGVEIIRFGDSSHVGSYAISPYFGLYDRPKTSADISRQTWCNMPENWNRQQHICGNVKPGVVNGSVFFFYTSQKWYSKKKSAF
jgi:hypothetical protein